VATPDVIKAVMTFTAAAAEGSRQLLHIAMGGFALLLAYLTWFQAVLCAIAALLFNLVILRRVSRTVFRPGEITRPAASGIILYPGAILALLLIFHDRLDIVAAAWGILAVGDGMATIIGSRFPILPLPWNRRKSLGGSLAMILFGGLAGSFLAWWCAATVMPPAYPWFVVVAPVIAAVAAAAVESIPIALDDNISVPASAAGVLWMASLVTADGLATMAGLADRLPSALAANILVAAAGYAARTVTIPGAIAGAVLGTTIALCAGWAGWALLLVTFACAVISSRMGLRRKLVLGIAEARGGRRGPGNAIANTGVAALAALMAVLGYAPEAALLAMVAALAAGGSDTVASEIGKAWGRSTYLVTTGRRVNPGTPGAMSVEGTVAGLAGAALLGGLGVVLGLVGPSALLPVVAGATAGALAESAMGATLEPRGILNNDVLNFLNTGIAAWVAVAWLRWL
jgi:uncharacterized protein (TIGR00297 family)